MKHSKKNPRIKKVFDACIRNTVEGKEPNVSGEMRKAGYAETSCRALKVTQTKPWKELLDTIDDFKVLEMFNEIVSDKKDKRARIAAGIEIMKLKDRYPKQKVSLGVFDEREEVFE